MLLVLLTVISTAGAEVVRKYSFSLPEFLHQNDIITEENDFSKTTI